MSFLIPFFVSVLSGPSSFAGSFRVSASVCAHGHHLCCHAAAGCRRLAGSMEPALSPSSLEGVSCVSVFRKALRILIISVTSACQFWLMWAGRRKHGWMQGQHNCLSPALSRDQAELFDTGGELAALCNFMSLPAPKGSETRRQHKTLRRWVCLAFVIFKYVHGQCCRVLAGPADFFSCAYYQIYPEEQ